MRMLKWPSIEQYRNVIRNVQHRAQYKGKDESGEAIMDRGAALPTLKFEGTVKLHGTNAAVVSSPNGEMWAQSRENILSVEKDNAGFAAFFEMRRDVFAGIANRAARAHPNSEGKDIAIYGEWCGGNIQKGVAICGLPKMFVVFGIALVDEAGERTYLTRKQVLEALDSAEVAIDNSIFCAWSFPTFSVEIDFANPHLAQNALNEITLAVENECPVGKAFGVSGVGEGVVWRCVEPGYESSDFWFKVKGEAHSKSKVRTLATVDVERIESVKALAAKLANPERLAQMHQQVFDTLNGGSTDVKRTGDFIKAVMSDALKEELDTIEASGFTTKELSSPMCTICRSYLSEN